MIARHVAVVVPARNEVERIGRCLRHLSALRTDERVATLTLLVLANNCSDDTALLTRDIADSSTMPIFVEDVALPADRANAGWARRLAFDAGLRHLSDPHDLLMCTDADTVAADDWLVKTLDHVDAGFDAVAGFSRLHPRELRKLDPAIRRRFAAIRRYEDAFDWLKSRYSADEPTPRHFYEGGASIALSVAAYREIGGAPTPRVGEDKALFDALRAKGRRIRHAKDVRVLTSCRLDGRASDGAADTLARWSVQDVHEPLWGLQPVVAALGLPVPKHEVMTLARLPAETETARALIRSTRSKRSMAKTG